MTDKLPDFGDSNPFLVLIDSFDIDDVDNDCLYFPRCREKLFGSKDGEKKVPDNRVISCKYCPIRGKAKIKIKGKETTDFDQLNDTYTINAKAIFNPIKERN